jgi:hypothetical protein
MLMLLCIQIVQTNNNESNWRQKKNKQFSNANKPNKIKMNLSRKQNFLIINKIHKLIIKQFKLNVSGIILEKSLG